MTTRIPFDISGLNIIPSQDLEGKIGYIARIEDACVEKDRTKVKLRNMSPIFKTFSETWFDNEDTTQILNSYNIKDVSELVGKEAITLYKNSRLYGIAPLVFSSQD